MPSMNRDEFLDRYVLRLDKEFEYDGKSPEWAPSTSGGPLIWGQENTSLDLFSADGGSINGRSHVAMALSPDHRFLAVAIDAIIRIYRFETKELITELRGHLDDIGKLFFAPKKVEMPAKAKHLLFSESQHRTGVDEMVVLWHLNEDGQSLTKVKSFHIRKLTEKAISSISDDLKSEHHVSASQLEDLTSSLKADLEIADTKNHARSLITIPGNFPSKGTFVNSSKMHLITTAHDQPDINGVRRRDKAQDLIIRSLSNPSHITQTLQGHTDRILWAAFSPTNPDIVASASWDGSYRIWNTDLGECLHTILPEAGKQNWSGAFSPDGRQVFLAGTDNTGIYSVQDGSRLSNLDLEAQTYSYFARYNAWSPTGDVVAIAADTSILLWEPTTGRREEILKLEKDEERLMESFKRLSQLRWLDRNGEKLWVGLPGNSCAVWDRKRNWKWRFVRPKEVALRMNMHTDVLYVEEKDLLVMLNGDGKIREWSLS